MNDAEYDYSKFVEPANLSDGSNSLATLSDLASKQLDAQIEVTNLQAQLAKAQERLKDISERQFPEAMEQIGMTDFTTKTGLKVFLDETVRASVSKDMKERAWAWLRANGHAALLKRKIMVEFGKGEDVKAEDLKKTLSSAFDGVVDEINVHHSTLAAFVREQLKKGKEIPLDVFGVYKQRITKIEMP